MTQVPAALEEGGGQTPAVPDRLTSGIVLDHVSFRYPDTDRLILDDVSLMLPAGKMVALVGENGAGKTSLVKLLCRLYAPVGGSIVVDGTALERFPHEAWRARLGVGNLLKASGSGLQAAATHVWYSNIALPRPTAPVPSHERWGFQKRGF